MKRERSLARAVPWSTLLLGLLACTGPAAATPRSEGADDSLRAVVTRGRFTDPAAWDIDRWQGGVAAFYNGRAYRPLWFARGAQTRASRDLIGELGRAEERGLSSSDYDVAALEHRFAQAQRLTAEESARLDVALTVVAARFAADLHAGRIRPSDVGYELDAPAAPFDALGAVAAIAASADVTAALDALEPPLHHYGLLKAALKDYRTLAAAHPDLTRLPPLPKARVAIGETYGGSPQLRRLLIAEGDLVGPSGVIPDDSTVLDASLVEALRRFQQRHGLEVDGVLGRGTYAALTVPFAHRVRQIELSMERIRWLPAFDSPPIIVNIPQFRLFAFRTVRDRADDILQMDVIVGSSFKGRHTPVFAANLRTVVLQPYWDVPRSILRNELLSQARRDPDWLTRNDYEIVRGESDESPVLAASAANIRLLEDGTARLRQKPGKLNALGRVKFVFPNHHNVYLHDTPARSLFRQSRRAFSHGCIRVSDPMALLEHVMRDVPTWSVARREEALERETPTRVPLARPIRVLILYGTALAKEDGTVQFFEDIYGHDEPLARKLSSRRR